jgi:hypothetical protein
MNKIPIQRISFPILYSVLVKKQGELIMKRYVTATALTCLFVSSSFTVPKPVYADSGITNSSPAKEVVIKAIVRDKEYTIKLISQEDNVWTANKAWDKTDWVVIDKSRVLDDKSFLSEKGMTFTLNSQYVWQIKKNDVVIGTGIEAELVDNKWTAFCLPTQKTEENKISVGKEIVSSTAAAAGAKGGAVGGAAIATPYGIAYGTATATAACLASLGLTAASFGATTLLSVGVCGGAIAAGAAAGGATAAAIGGVVGGGLGGFIGKFGVQGVLNYFDVENCVKKELTVKTPNDQAPTYKCEVWCDACKIIKHSRNHLVYASKSQGAETKAKDEYIAYFTENKTTSDIMARHNQHDHLKATCERIEGTKQ